MREYFGKVHNYDTKESVLLWGFIISINELLPMKENK